MKEIKYRMWDENHKTMYYDQHEVIECLKQQATGMYNHIADGCVFEQFTGLHDKNDKDIYEGDIVNFVQNIRTGTRRVTRSRGYDTYAIRTYAEITAIIRIGAFEKHACVAYYETQSKESYDSYFYCSGKKTDTPKKVIISLNNVLNNDVQYTVIGNIHQNPELLNTE